jgi:hypothetical protein
MYKLPIEERRQYKKMSQVRTVRASIILNLMKTLDLFFQVP